LIFLFKLVLLIKKQLFSLLKIIVSLCAVFVSFEASAGDPFGYRAGARETGMARVCIINSDPWTSFNNQAALAFNNNYSFGFNYENRFGVSELGTRTAALIIPAGKVSLGAEYSYFGYSDFRRQMVGLACGMPLSKVISAGIQIDYFSEKTTGEYQNSLILTCEAGIIVNASEKVKISLHMFNPVPNSMRKSDLSTSMNVGAMVNLNKELSAGAETAFTRGGKLVLRTGFEYEAIKNFMVRGGFSSENNSFCFGVGYMAGSAKVDLGFATHERLGITSAVSIFYNINYKK
jgi:hypothetical protein